jgi:hypothetical protein
VTATFYVRCSAPYASHSIGQEENSKDLSRSLTRRLSLIRGDQVSPIRVTAHSVFASARATLSVHQAPNVKDLASFDRTQISSR